MSHEKLGRIRQLNGQIYNRKQPGVNLPTDYMTDEEIVSLSGEVTTYYVEVEK